MLYLDLRCFMLPLVYHCISSQTVECLINCSCIFFCLLVVLGHAHTCPGSIMVYILLQRTLSQLCIDPSLVQSLFCLCLVPQEHHFECFTIRRWHEALTVYPRTNKQNQKKKRKVDPPTHQVMTLFTHSVMKCFHFAHTEQGQSSKQPKSVCFFYAE